MKKKKKGEEEDDDEEEEDDDDHDHDDDYLRFWEKTLTTLSEGTKGSNDGLQLAPVRDVFTVTVLPCSLPYPQLHIHDNRRALLSIKT